MRKIILYMIVACVLLLLTLDFQEGFGGKYILKSKIVPPVCPKCPDLVNVCEPKPAKCPPCRPCGRCKKHHKRNDDEDEYISMLPIPFGFKRAHDSRQDRRRNYKRYAKGEKEPMPWLNSFSEF